ncbi:MAG: DUF1015 domain-containing protein, partial [Blastocatellia bacterium]|nr:DUF1015 domain-containing protein [Blastocatellia bacterium]
MAKIYPFRGWRYNREKVGDLAAVVTQPYDKITPAMQKRYYGQSPYNFVRLILGERSPEDTEANNVYTRAREELLRWMRDGVLVEDRAPAIYVYVQRYRVPLEGSVKVRKGFLALGQLEDFGRGIIFPHERTLRGPKEDRLRLLRTVRAHLEPIFMLYDDPAFEVQAILDRYMAESPEVEVADEYGVEHRLWPIYDPEAIVAVQQLMAPRSLVIADGHHRYETALIYRDEQRAHTGRVDEQQPHERMLMAFFNLRDEGLMILPTHRLIVGVEAFDPGRFLDFVARHFEVTELPLRDLSTETLAHVRARLAEEGKRRITFGLLLAGRATFYLLGFRPTTETEAHCEGLTPLERTLDTAVLHRVLIEHGLGVSEEAIQSEQHIVYVREFEEGARAVWEGHAQLGFFLNPTRVEQVYEMALSGRLMP